jgi:AraC family transcriptional regulator
MPRRLRLPDSIGEPMRSAVLSAIGRNARRMPATNGMQTDEAIRVVKGRSAYAGILARAGGRELEALQRSDVRGAPAVAMYSAPPYDMDVPALDVARLSINLSPAHLHGRLDGDRPRSFVTRRHSLFLTPAGAPAHWRKDEPSRHINIYFDDTEREAAPLLNATVPGLTPLLEMLATELLEAAPFAEAAADSLACLILVRLARRHAVRVAADPLTAALVERVHDFVAANLERRLLVADLAAVVGMPTNAFAQAFMARTGRSPHQFVIERRLERAAERLRHTEEPLADVAASCGFASQQHLTQWMKRRMGITPARWRATRARDVTDRDREEPA